MVAIGLGHIFVLGHVYYGAENELMKTLKLASLAKKDADLILTAKKAASNAYAPYSGFAVGAAARTTDGTIHIGANLENASYVRIPTQIDIHSAGKSAPVPIEIGTCSDANRHTLFSVS